MTQFLVKTIVSALIIAFASEASKKSLWLGAILISLPLSSVLALSWFYVETKQVERVAALSQSIFWMVLPSLAFFWILPALLRTGLGFWGALLAACGATAAVYYGYSLIMRPWLGD